MGQRTRADGERTRMRILEEALPLFAEHGFAGTSIRTVAHAAQVNVATLAYHFEGKQGLYVACLHRLHEDLMHDFPADLPTGLPDEQLRWLADTAWEFAMAHRPHMRLLVRQVLASGGHSEQVVDTWSEPLLERAEAVVGLFRPGWSRVHRRLLVLAASHLIVRFALEDRSQLRKMLGGTDDLDRDMKRFYLGFLRRELGLPDLA